MRSSFRESEWLIQKRVSRAVRGESRQNLWLHYEANCLFNPGNTYSGSVHRSRDVTFDAHRTSFEVPVTVDIQLSNTIGVTTRAHQEVVIGYDCRQLELLTTTVY